MDEQDETSRRWFDPRKVRLEVVDDVSAYFDEEALIGLSGAMSDSTVTVRKIFSAPATYDGEPVLEAIRLQIHHQAVFSMSRLLRRTPAGEWSVENAKFRIRHEFAGRRLSARSLVIQARAAQELGFQHIALDAVGDYTMARLKFPDDRWAGYWVWPRLGFDATVPESARRRLPARFRSCHWVSELMSSNEGLDAWELHGETLQGAKFDLTANSTSWQLLAKYNLQRNIKV
jgi:hypothetical protein